MILAIFLIYKIFQFPFAGALQNAIVGGGYFAQIATDIVFVVQVEPYYVRYAVCLGCFIFGTCVLYGILYAISKKQRFGKTRRENCNEDCGSLRILRIYWDFILIRCYRQLHW